MGLQHKRDIYIKRAKRTLVAAVILFVAALNVVRFCTDIRANNRFIYNYQIQEDLFANYRAPVPFAVYSTIFEPFETRALVLPKARLQDDDVIFQNVIQTAKIYLQNKDILFVRADIENHNQLSVFFPTAQTLYYGQTSTDALMKTLEKKLSNKNIVLVLVENLDSSEKTAGTEALQALAKKQNWRPQLFNLVNRTTLDALEEKYLQKPVFSLETQEQNLKHFLFDFEPILRRILDGHKDDMPEPLFDKATFMAFDETPQGCIPVYGAPDQTQAFLYGIYAARKALADKPSARLYILTSLFEQPRISEAELLKKLAMNKDGVLIEYRGRYALMAPCAWQKFKDPKSFLQQLKMKAGLSPDYWAEGTKIFLFRTVEVLKNEH